MPFAKRFFLLFVCLVLGISIVPTTPVFAQENAHQLWGKVFINGNPAPYGTVISAWIGDVESGLGTVDDNGRYGYTPNFFVTASQDLIGQPISFYVGTSPDLAKAYSNGVLVEGVLFEFLGTTNVDLAIGEGPPDVITRAATGITRTSAVLNGNLTSLGDPTSVQVSFEWGTDASYGNETAPDTMMDIGAFSAPIDELSPGTIYHYRAKAIGNGTAYGEDMTFTTESGICGDATGNGKVTVSDGRRIFLHILDPDTYPIVDPWAADVTGNGKITVSDGRRIFLHILDPDTYPLECP
jgi:hypothetical protein